MLEVVRPPKELRILDLRRRLIEHGDGLPDRGVEIAARIPSSMYAWSKSGLTFT
jgi:hypothetical protein